MKLTPKQQAFCEEYVANGGNATAAAIKAGYSPDTAKVIGYENLTKPYIKDHIAELARPAKDRRIATAQDLLEALTDIINNPEEKTADRLKAIGMMGDYRSLWDGTQGRDARPDTGCEITIIGGDDNADAN